MDLNSIAQSGVDPTTGEYLTPEERKEAFRKSLGKKTTMSGSKFTGGKKESGLVKQHNFVVIEKLIEVKKVADELHKTKAERVKLESKFASAQRLSKEKEKKSQEESRKERGFSFGGGKNIFKSFATKAAASVGGGLFGILKAVITYGILDWISKPENKKTIETFVKVFMNIFKFFDMYVGGMIENLLGGFTKLFGGGSILERVFGGLQLILGIFMFKGFTRVLNPLKLIGDIKWAIKNAKNFKDLFGSLFSKNLKGVGDAIKKIFPKTASIFKKGLAGTLKRVFLKVFGKGLFTFLKPFVKTITRTIVRPIAKAVTRVPIVGALLAIPINMFLGDPIDKAAVKAIGAGLGTFVVGALGSIVPGAGTVLGGIAGGLIGDFLAGWLYDSVIAPLGKTLFGGKKDQPQLNTGGIASGPESGYDVTLHGTEAVIPIDKLKDIVLLPYKTVASIIMGSTFAVLKSMGGVGSMIAPIALQMFNPYIRLFGISVETFSTGLGKGGDLLIPSVSTKEPETPEDYPEKSNDKSTGGRSTGGGSTGGGGDSSGDLGIGDGEYGETPLIAAAKKAGIQGKELAAFLAQMSHETGEFRHREEISGGKDSYGGGKRYMGRGYIQLTHDYNYKYYGDKLGVDLLNKPELAKDGELAAKIAILYWMEQVRPMVKNDWDNVFLHSKAVNYPIATRPSQINGYPDRVNKYEKYKKKLQQASTGGEIKPTTGEGRSGPDTKGILAKLSIDGKLPLSSEEYKEKWSGDGRDEIVKKYSAGGKSIVEGAKMASGGAVSDWNRRFAPRVEDPLVKKKKEAKQPPDWQKFAAGGKFKNGQLPEDQLESIGGGHKLHKTVAKQFRALQTSAKKDGHTFGINSSYRSYQRQKELYASLGPGTAAYPGTSNHGLGLAVDLNYSDAGYKWLRKNAKTFGFGQIPGYETDNPDGHEAWHWENVSGKGSIGGGAATDSGTTPGGDSPSPSDTGTSVSIDPEKIKNSLGQLFTILTGNKPKSEPESSPQSQPKISTTTPPAPIAPAASAPPPAPSAPTLPNITPVPKSSALPAMSSQFALDKKMSVVSNVQSPTTIINRNITNMGSSFYTDPLNNMTISEKANLNLL